MRGWDKRKWEGRKKYAPSLKNRGCHSKSLCTTASNYVLYSLTIWLQSTTPTRDTSLMTHNLQGTVESVSMRHQVTVQKNLQFKYPASEEGEWMNCGRYHGVVSLACRLIMWQDWGKSKEWGPVIQHGPLEQLRASSVLFAHHSPPSWNLDSY